jgi:hypothetical protein
MKRLFFLLFSTCAFFAQVQAQRIERLPAPGEVAPEYRKEYRTRLAAYERTVKRLEAQGWDFYLDDLSSVPTAISTSATAQTNWGEQVLLPAAIRQRIASECTYPVVVKIADTGGKFTHTDLQEGQLPGSTYTGEPLPDDGNGHGTHCAGIIAGRDIGLAYDLVKAGRLKFKPVKILSNSGGGSFSWVANAYATERTEDKSLRAGGAAVIYSNSFGGGTAIIQPVEDELKRSTEAGVYFAFASGNTSAAVNYPGLSQYVAAIGSLDQNMTVSSYSSRGPELDFAMPGRNINSTYLNNAYATLSGTSMATPFFAAASAIALSKWGMGALPNQAALQAYMQKIATDILPAGRDDASGWGVAYILAILNTSPGGTPPPPPPPPSEPEPSIQVQTTVTDGFVIRYRFAGDQKDRILQIKSVTMFTPATSAESSIDNARAYCRAFFPTHQIVEIPVKEGLDGAAYWAGQFFEYWGKNNAKPLQVDELIVADEEGRTFSRVGFDRANLPDSYDGQVPRLVRAQ